MSEMEVQQIVENDLAAISAVIHMNDLEASDQPNEELIASFLYSTLVAQKNSSEPVEIEDRVDEYEDFIVVTQPKLPIMLKKFYGKFGKVLRWRKLGTYFQCYYKEVQFYLQSRNRQGDTTCL